MEPYRLVSTGSRWYLVAYDLEREDWRTFRVDRVSEPFATGARFAARALPMEAEEFVRRGLRGGETYRVEVTFAAPVDALPGWLRGTPWRSRAAAGCGSTPGMRPNGWRRGWR